MRRSPAATAHGESTLRNGHERQLEIARKGGDIPATWLTPTSAGPVPAVLLLHGLSSNKERSFGQVPKGGV